MTGILVAAIVVALTFRMLQWPGGLMLSTLVVPILLIVEGIPLCKHTALREMVAKGNKKAQCLLLVEIAVTVSLIVFGIGIIFRGLHWPGGAEILMTGTVSLAILSPLAGCLGASIVKK